MRKIIMAIGGITIPVGSMVEVVVDSVHPFGLLVNYQGVQAAIDNVDIPTYPDRPDKGDRVEAVLIGSTGKQYKFSMLPRFFNIREQWEEFKKSYAVGDILPVSCVVRYGDGMVAGFSIFPGWAKLDEGFKEFKYMWALEKQLQEKRLVAQIVDFDDWECMPVVSLLPANS